MMDFPDSTLGTAEIAGTYYLCSASGYVPSIGTPGAVCLTSPSIDSLENNYTEINTTTNIGLGPGEFGQNYVGGGPLYYDAADGILIMMYHAEYWYNPPNLVPFWSGLGLAVSSDLGVTWTKLGAVIVPNVSVASLGACSGNPTIDIGSGTLVARSDGYFYAYFNDQATGACSARANHTGVARASISSVIAAALAGGLPSGTLFMKYSGGSFSTPGVNDSPNPQNGGGTSDNIGPGGGGTQEPNVAFNSVLNEYLMAYDSSDGGIAIAESSDGINWTNSQKVLSGGAGLLMPTLINTSGGSPTTLGSSFYLYYDQNYGNWADTNYDCVQLTLAAGSR